MKKIRLRKNPMDDCISLREFYRCIRKYMKKYRGSSNIKKIQKAHYAAVRECTNIVKADEPGMS